MSTVVAVMDRPGEAANTDVIVVARPRRRELLWVPRDLWSERFRCRINKTFALGGHDVLLRALRAAGVRAGHSVCVPRPVCEEILDPIEVTVPVDQPLRYWYPLTPSGRLEDARKLIRFEPPSERLSGERLHQWLGARLAVGRPSGDLERIGRQQVALREVLRGARTLEIPVERLSLSDPAALEDLSQVGPDWRFTTLTDFVPATVGGAKVAFRRRFRGRLGRLDLRRRVAASGGELD
jgi:anionic cell wall polymer biosynthesis LytR-Cps2A-Psr (LCP) family protein